MTIYDGRLSFFFGEKKEIIRIGEKSGQSWEDDDLRIKRPLKRLEMGSGDLIKFTLVL